MDIGGQAVIEGVMMRNKERYAVAVRLKNGNIKVRKEKSSSYPEWLNVFFIRGVVGLGYTFYDGVRALIWSNNQNLGERDKLNKKEIALTLTASFLFAILIFVIVPFFSAHWINSEGMLFDVIDGLLRIALFLGYIILISFTKDVKTLFRYHGAEHKAVHCYEAGKELTIHNVRKFSRFHPRCGTSFLFIVLLISIVVFTFIPGSTWFKFIGRIALLPVVAGISYEIIKLSAKYQKNILVKVLIAPGLRLQRITTNEPTDNQIEVGIASLKAVVK